MAVRVLGPVTYGADSSTVVWVLAEGFVSCHVYLSAIIIPVPLVLQICLQQFVSQSVESDQKMMRWLDLISVNLGNTIDTAAK